LTQAGDSLVHMAQATFPDLQIACARCWLKSASRRCTRHYRAAEDRMSLWTLTDSAAPCWRYPLRRALWSKLDTRSLTLSRSAIQKWGRRQPHQRTPTAHRQFTSTGRVRPRAGTGTSNSAFPKAAVGPARRHRRSHRRVTALKWLL